MTPYSLLEVNQHFGGMCCLQFQGRIASQARNQHKLGSNLNFLVYYGQSICLYVESVRGDIWDVSNALLSPHTLIESWIVTTEPSHKYRTQASPSKLARFSGSATALLQADRDCVYHCKAPASIRTLNHVPEAFIRQGRKGTECEALQAFGLSSHDTSKCTDESLP